MSCMYNALLLSLPPCSTHQPFEYGEGAGERFVLGAVDGIADVEEEIGDHFQLAEASLAEHACQQGHALDALGRVVQDSLKGAVDGAQLRGGLQGKKAGQPRADRLLMEGCQRTHRVTKLGNGRRALREL